MTFTNTLSEELARAYVASRLDEASAHRTSVRGARRGRIRRRRTVAPDLYTDYLIARGGTTR